MIKWKACWEKEKKKSNEEIVLLKRSQVMQNRETSAFASYLCIPASGETAKSA